MKDTLYFVGLMVLNVGLLLIISAIVYDNTNIVLVVGYSLFNVGLGLFVRSSKDGNNE